MKLVQTWRRVKIKRDICHCVGLREINEFFLHKHRFANTCGADEHDGVARCHEQIQKESYSDALLSVY